MQEKFIVAADPGSSKISLSVTSLPLDGAPAKVLFYSELPSEGISDGGVFNPVKAADVLGKLIENAEQNLSIKINRIVVPLPRYKIATKNGESELTRSNPDSFISPEEISSLKDFALEKYLPDPDSGEDVFSIVPQSYSTEDLFQAAREDVIGSCSKTISGDYKIFYGPVKAEYNVEKMISSCSRSICGRCFLPTMMGRVLVTKEEMENGAALVEMGAGVTSVSIFSRGILRYYDSIPFGGKTITEDIRLETGFSENLCESIKLAYGFAFPERLQSLSEKILQIEDERSGENNQLSLKYLSEIINTRLVEIFSAILHKIGESGYADRLRGGIVLCGGGGELTGCATLLKEMSGYNVRCGYAHDAMIDISGCMEMDSSSAAAHYAMILNAIEDDFPDGVTEDSIREQDSAEEDERKETIFDENAWETVNTKVKTPKVPKTPKTSKASSALGDIFSIFSDGYKNMGNPE